MKALALLVLGVVALQAGFLLSISTPAATSIAAPAPAEVTVARGAAAAPAPTPQPARS